MDLWFWFCCVYLWTGVLLRRASPDPEPAPRYVVHQAALSFDQASTACSDGFLTTLRTEPEARRVLELVSSTKPERTRFTFWVGLKKVKSDCVIQALPLRGFKWVVDDSEVTQVSRWLEEPEETCTLRCASLSVEVSGSNVTRWGLVPVSCKNKYKSICKLEGTQQLKPSVAGRNPDEQTQMDPEPTETAVRTFETAGSKPAPTEASPEPRPTIPGLKEPEPSKVLVNNTTDPEVLPKPAIRSEELGPKLVPGSRLCLNPSINGSRSISLDHEDVNRVLLDCFSDVKLVLVCSGRPAVWRLLDNSTFNPSSICQLCSPGFRKNSVGKCEDVDECGAGGAGSYRCVCLDQDSPECLARKKQDWVMRILLPVLVAVAVLLIVVVVVTVTVKCCLKRRSKKRAMKKAEKMEHTFQTANEKAAP